MEEERKDVEKSVANPFLATKYLRELARIHSNQQFFVSKKHSPFYLGSKNLLANAHAPNLLETLTKKCLLCYFFRGATTQFPNLEQNLPQLRALFRLLQKECDWSFQKKIEIKSLECATNMSVIKAFKDFVSTMPSPRIHIPKYICLQMFQNIFTRAYAYILAICLPDNHCISSIEIYTFHLKVFESWPSFLNCSRGGTRNKRTRFREKGKGHLRSRLLLDPLVPDGS